MTKFGQISIIGCLWLACVWIHSIIGYYIPLPEDAFGFMFAYMMTHFIVFVAYTAYMGIWIYKVGISQARDI